MHDQKLNKQVVLSPSGKTFDCLPETGILASGLGSGIALPYSCANGSCGECRAKVVSGQVRKIRFHDFALTAAEKLANICLLCSNTAESDLTIEVVEATSAHDIPIQSLRGKVCHLEAMAEVVIVRCKLARGKALRYLPGQYATIRADSGASITLPVANCPCEPDYLEFHFPKSSGDICNGTHSETRTGKQAWGETTRMANAASTDTLGEHETECGKPTTNEPKVLNPADLAPRERITIEGPTGRFIIRERQNGERQQHGEPFTSPDPVYFIASGLGFSAIKPLMEHVMSQDSDTPCTLIWIASSSVSHYLHNLCRSWSDAFDNIRYEPISNISEFTASSIKTRGLQQIEASIYISGDSHINTQVRKVLLGSGVSSRSIHVDATITS